VERPAQPIAAPSAPFAAGRRLELTLDGARWSLAATAVDGVGRIGALRAVPGAAPAVLGLTEWRGRIVTVIDLAAALYDRSPRLGEAGWLLRLAAPLGHAALALSDSPRLAPSDANDGPTIDPAAVLSALRVGLRG